MVKRQVKRHYGDFMTSVVQSLRLQVVTKTVAAIVAVARSWGDEEYLHFTVSLKRWVGLGRPGCR